MLPDSLEIDGIDYPIDSDFRTVLLIMDMYSDKKLSEMGKHLTMLEILFTPIPNEGEDPITNIPPNFNEAVKQAMWFLDIGQTKKVNYKPKKDIDGKLIKDTNGNVIMEIDEKPEPVLLDYKQDEQMLFSAVNAVFSRDIRAEKNLHWWTFYGLCQSISSDSLMSTIMSIRNKIAKGDKLDDQEKKYVRDNNHIVVIRKETDENEYDDLANDLRNLRQ